MKGAMRRSANLLRGVVLVGAVACGGKIVETTPFVEPKTGFTDETDREAKDARSAQQPAAGTTPGHPAPQSTSPLDACAVLCERDARCDTTLPALPVREGEDGDCSNRCEARLSGDECGMENWLSCYAASVDPKTCTPLPGDCRPAYCAWARCAKQPVSNCE